MSSDKLRFSKLLELSTGHDRALISERIIREKKRSGELRKAPVVEPAPSKTQERKELNPVLNLVAMSIETVIWLLDMAIRSISNNLYSLEDIFVEFLIGKFVDTQRAEQIYRRWYDRLVRAERFRV